MLFKHTKWEAAFLAAIVVVCVSGWPIIKFLNGQGFFSLLGPVWRWVAFISFLAVFFVSMYRVFKKGE